jgi:hypothetical protein
MPFLTPELLLVVDYRGWSAAMEGAAGVPLG